jgi:hypothetical protein
MKMGPIRCPETSVNNYHTTPCNYPEDHRFLSTSRRKPEIYAIHVSNHFVQPCATVSEPEIGWDFNKRPSSALACSNATTDFS